MADEKLHTGPGDVVVSFEQINELMGEKRQVARAEMEKAEAEKAAKEEIPAPSGGGKQAHVSETFRDASVPYIPALPV